MSLLWIDGFDNYGTSVGSAPAPTGIIGRKYVTLGESYMRVRAGRLGAYALDTYATGTNSYIQKTLVTAQDTLIAGFAVKFLTLDAARLLSFYDGAQRGVNLYIQTSGEMKLYLDTTAIPSAVTSGAGILTNIWFYIELKVKCHASAGTIDVVVNGVNVLTMTGQNTKAGTHNYHDCFKITGTSYANQTYYDDLYVCDNSGTANNDFLGPRRVVTLYPSANGDSANWTPLSGDNYTNVDDGALQDANTTYVSTAASNAEDLYNYTDLVTNPSIINGIMICTDSRVNGAGPYSIQDECKSVNTTSNSANQVFADPTNYTTSVRILETDPATANAWTVNGLDAAQFGFHLI